MHTFAQPLGRALSVAAGSSAVVCEDRRRTYAELGYRFTQAEPLARFIAEERATLATAVPTVWYDILGLDPASVDLTSLRLIMAGGAAVPRRLIETYEQRFCCCGPATPKAA